MKKKYEEEVVRRHVPVESPISGEGGTAGAEVEARFLRPGQLLSRQEEFPVAFQPIGTLEWHGRHNPLGCDALKAERLCIKTAEEIGGVVMPPIYFSSDSYRNKGKGYGLGMDTSAGFQLPGSFYMISNDLFLALLKNACSNYLSRGFKLVVLVSGHNPEIQKNLMDEVCYFFKTDDGREPVVSLMEFEGIEEGNPRRHSDHAGGYETSMMLYLYPEKVNLSANKNTEVPLPGVGENNSLPYNKASGEEGKIRFELQWKGLASFVKRRFDRLS